MTFLEWLDRRALRRERRFHQRMEAKLPSALLDRFPGWPSEQFVIAMTVVLLFGFAYVRNPGNDTLEGALIAGFAGAWGYFLGSSDAGKRAGERADKVTVLAHDALRIANPAPPPDVVLKPGETAQADPVAASGDDPDDGTARPQ